MYQHKKIIATVEARTTSTRLPGKVLLPLLGKPALEQLIHRLKPSRYIDEIVVATTTNTTDDVIVGLARRVGVKSFRGSEKDVLSRVLGAAKSVEADIICEVTGDCPLVDVELIDQGIGELFAHAVEYVGNVFPTTYPIGFDVQIFPTSVLARVDRLTQDPLDRVHVSYYIYMHPEQFKVRMWRAEGEYFWPELRVTLDEQKDYDFLKAIFERFIIDHPLATALEIIRFLKQHPELLAINQYVRQKELIQG